MKTSWVIGVVMLYLIIMGLESWASGGVSLGTNVATGNQSVLMSPAIAEQTTTITGLWASVIHVKDYFVTYLAMLVLWSPTVFSGYLLWVWWGICFPVDVAMVFGIVSMMRGVHSA